MGLFSNLLIDAGIGNADYARALSVAQLAQRDFQEAALMQQYRPSANDRLGLLNYRPPVHVPAGWADWSAHAGEMV